MPKLKPSLLWSIAGLLATTTVFLLPIIIQTFWTTMLLPPLPKEFIIPTLFQNRENDVGGAASPPPIVAVRFHLQQQNLQFLERRLYEIADPSHADYGRWMTVEELTEWIAPSQVDLNRVIEWVTKAHGGGGGGSDDSASVVSVSSTRDSVLVHWNADVVENVLGDGSKSSSSTAVHSSSSLLSMAIPSEISPLVELITASPIPNNSNNSNTTTTTPNHHPHRTKSSPPLRGAYDGRDVTPQIIYQTYNLNMTTGLTNGPILTSQTAAEFEEAYFYPNDISLFEHQNNLPSQNITRIIGKNDPDNGYLGEASLDVQYLIAAAPTVPTWVISLFAFDPAAWVEEILALGDGKEVPRVHSVSWGMAEMDYDDAWVYRMNRELMKLALVGHSVLVASGDEGAGNEGLGILCRRFQPVFPATSPFVTAVGGTYLDQKTNTETGWKYSGGGFSDRFLRPPYQQNAVQTYLQTLQTDGTIPPPNMYNHTGRAVPDVSALATNYQVVIEKDTGPMSGTSASTPTFAGFVSRLNQQRRMDGKPVLGFLNPLLYWLKEQEDGGGGSGVFWDITEGDNRPRVCRRGWAARVGWDAITGLGTPNVEELLKMTK